MNRSLIEKSVGNFRNVIAININHARGREFIPRKRDCLSIGTSSICNLNCCFCAYPKKQSARVVMDDLFFQNCVAQAVDLGYQKFDLTPCTGDIFMDRTFLDKLTHLEHFAGVVSYAFHTNFTIPRHRDIERLARLKKIDDLHISIYGHDPGTFTAITKSTEKLYKRLVSNLEFLYDLVKKHPLPVQFAFHTGVKSLRGRSSAMIDILEKFKKAGATVTASKGLYNNWGGYVTQEDVKDIPITVIGPNLIYKKGACVNLFTTIQIMATGIVNGCACRDADATLRLGNLHEKPLKDVISSRNPAYMALIEEQQNGVFHPVCRSCDYYASIYHKSSVYKKTGIALQSLEEFRASLP